MMRREPEQKPWWPSHIQPPKPQQFGLEASFNAQACLDAATKRKAQRDKQFTIVSVVLGIVVMAIAAGVLFNEGDHPIYSSWVGFTGPAWFGVIASVPIKAGLVELDNRRNPNPFPPDVTRYFDALAKFDAAVKDYNDRQLETGLTYWKEKRGVAFENALESFFKRRGCKVQTTKGSGDGGIDLIVNMAGQTFWCQAKGHASPIGVAVIREIAGVCSRGGGGPLVIAVNGYTASAISTANELGVLLVDSPNLVRMATRETIAQLE